MNAQILRKNTNQGFTLLEIIVVVAIIGILAVVAVPLYNDYIIRAQVTEAFVFADAERIKVIEKRIESSNFDIATFSEPKVHMTSLKWVPVANNNPVENSVIGYILPTMDLKGLGVRDTFALEYFYNGAWRCVNAANAIGRGAVSTNKALDDKYLPSSCLNGAGLLAAHPNVPAGCPSGTQKVQVKDANGKQQQVCQLPKTQKQPQVVPQLQPQLQPQAQPQLQQLTPSVIPIVKPQLKKCPGTLKLGSDGRCHTSSAPLPAQCPVGQDCGHHDPKCSVAGQEYIGATSVAVRDQHNPYGSNVYTTKTAIVPAQCVAKCKDGFVFNPKEPSKCAIAPSTNNHTCRGPKFICERSHVTTGATCTVDAPYAANFIENLKDGSRYVTRGCVTQQEAFEADKYNKGNANCKNYNVVVLQDAHFKCTFACYGDACNLESVPDHPATWGDGKSSTDLPDQFNTP
ncbi:prepilin-type N-terminal cleavage/methylation domain-containing protein [Pseudoalteromonas sp. NEC-BIFX-2020_015]|uniref:prepilin-type N-terminal cleavage/methylation domain-containing protein n=1 Tax=Pseudoalteromonas sp. NEC-BIFX-2020_015 TaxID=2729544 RepID=UPI00146169B2|nr:prepilin-type N-terminal cleavage/methylation domain-containing protein [Pseudoalteromonas sp. NEC-BIFX-2020_015]NMR28027.1 prepilin-type N-terminal cleavage/methylation domain-containing protein [Pseudoalteromonas sp. NEC-BIFX-2020_015]